jgi:hypothetical protein
MKMCSNPIIAKLYRQQYGPKVFLLTTIKPEYSDILYDTTHFPSPLVCRIRQIPLYIENFKIHNISFLVAMAILKILKHETLLD